MLKGGLNYLTRFENAKGTPGTLQTWLKESCFFFFFQVNKTNYIFDTYPTEFKTVLLQFAYITLASDHARCACLESLL